MIERLKDKYKIVRKIGSGGMAEIYHAVDRERNQPVAIKILMADKTNNYVHRRRFISEIEIMKRIQSPYVVKIYDASWDDDLHYIAMELVEGHILRDYISQKTRLTADEVVDFAKQMALGFAEIHKLGIVHRDIKSQNILVGNHGQIKIIDFGIALTDESERLTRDHHVVGSVQYTAPELIAEKAPTAQSDIYSFGILMYEMLTGEVPYKEKTALETLMKHPNSSVPFVTKLFPNVPTSLSNIVAKATQRDIKSRYSAMSDIYRDLTTALDNKRVIEKPLFFKKKGRWSFKEIINSRYFLFALIGAIAALVAIIVVIILVTVVL